MLQQCASRRVEVYNDSFDDGKVYKLFFKTKTTKNQLISIRYIFIYTSSTSWLPAMPANLKIYILFEYTIPETMRIRHPRFATMSSTLIEGEKPRDSLRNSYIE